MSRCLDIFGKDVEEELVFADTMVCTGCCATLDHIVTYLFKKVTNKGEWWCTISQTVQSFKTSNKNNLRSVWCIIALLNYARISQLERKCEDPRLRQKMTPLWLWLRSSWFDKSAPSSWCTTSVGSMIMFQIRRWGPKFSSKCSRLCWILSCLRTAGWHCLVFLSTLDSQICCQEPMEHEPAPAGPYPPQWRLLPGGPLENNENTSFCF